MAEEHYSFIDNNSAKPSNMTIDFWRDVTCSHPPASVVLGVMELNIVCVRQLEDVSLWMTG